MHQRQSDYHQIHRIEILSERQRCASLRLGARTVMGAFSVFVVVGPEQQLCGTAPAATDSSFYPEVGVIARDEPSPRENDEYWNKGHERWRVAPSRSRYLGTSDVLLASLIS